MQTDILSYDEYARRETTGFPVPYVVKKKHGDQHLLFYGSKHTNDPAHPQFKDIEERWAAFIAEAVDPIALVEGHFDETSEPDTANKRQSIISGGEAQFVVHLARSSHLPVSSPEPDRAWEANELAREFGRETVALYYFVRQLDWWNRLTEKPDVAAEASKMLHLMQKAYRWDDVDFSMEGMRTVHEHIFKKPLGLDNRQWLYDIITPATRDFVTNLIARRSGELRDEYILERIQEYWRNGMSPFAVFGAAHAVRLEPMLRKMEA